MGHPEKRIEHAKTAGRYAALRIGPAVFVVLKDTAVMKTGKVTDGGRPTDSSLSWSPLQLREESANSWSGLQLFSGRWLQQFSITSATFHPVYERQFMTPMKSGQRRCSSVC